MESNNSTNRFSIKIDKQIIKKALSATALLCAVILFTGMIFSVLKFRIEKDALPYFPKTRYLPAQKVKSGTFNIIDNAYFIRTLKQELENSHTSIRMFNDKISNGLRNKEVVVSQTNLYALPAASNLIGQYENKLKSDIKNFKIEISKSSYYTVSTLRQKQYAERKLANIQEFKKDFEKLSYKPAITYPQSNGFETFAFVVGKFNRIELSRTGGFFIIVDKANPVTSKDYLVKLNWNEKELSLVDFQEEAKRLEEVEHRDKEMFNNYLSQEKSKLRKVVREKRSDYRKGFYLKWFSVLINLIVNIIVLITLLQYIKIIRRKGLPKKTTHEIYFATNITSIFFRWIALSIAVMGFIFICVNFFIFIIAPEKIPFIDSLLSTSNIASAVVLLFAILIPLIFLIATVLLSWFILLEAEFICFISNVYHVLFVKAFKTDTEVKPNDISR